LSAPASAGAFLVLEVQVSVSDLILIVIFIGCFCAVLFLLWIILPYLFSKGKSSETVFIRHATIMFPDGKRFCGYSHSDCYDKAFLAENRLARTPGIIEGFEDSDGNFLDRFDAMIVAKKADQLRGNAYRDEECLASYMLVFSKKTSVEN
jgi:hypothetical protein